MNLYTFSSFRTGLHPLEVQVTEKKSELSKFESLIGDKKSELEGYQREIEEVKQELVKVKEGIGATLQTSPLVLGVTAISLLINLAAFSQIVQFRFFQDR